MFFLFLFGYRVVSIGTRLYWSISIIRSVITLNTLDNEELSTVLVSQCCSIHILSLSLLGSMVHLIWCGYCCDPEVYLHVAQHQGQVKVEKPPSHQAWGVTILPWRGFAVLFTCNFTSHSLFEQSKQKWLREWEIKGHFSGSAIGRPPLGVKAQEDSILCTSGRQKDHSDMTAQPRPRSSRSCHAFKQGSNGAIVMKEWVIRTGEKATCVDQSPKTRWDREDSVDICRNRGLGNKRCVSTYPLPLN